MKRKFLAAMLAAVLAVSGSQVLAQAVEADMETASSYEVEAVGEGAVQIVSRGECGENARYTLDSEGTLTISGSGKMKDYTDLSSSLSPFSKPAIKNIVIENGIESIGAYAFLGCGVTSASIPESVTSIGFRAFGSCTGLTSVNIPESVTSIEGRTFSGCARLTSVNIPKNVTSIDSSAFEGCSGLTKIEVDENNEMYGSADGILFDKTEKEILVCPAGKTGNCRIPEGMVRIGARAFEDCSELTSVNIPESVTSIGPYAFSGCSGLTSVNMLEGMTSISNDAFSGCSGLTSVNIPESVTFISDSAFSGCSGLTKIEVDENNETYGLADGVLFDKAKNEILVCPAGKTGSCQIPAGVRSIGFNVFLGCTGLTGVSIPESVTSIDSYAFSGCSGLTKIEVDENNEVYGSADGVLFDKAKNEILICPEGKTGSYQIPEGMTSIGEATFQGCAGLMDVNIPESVTRIGYSAFFDCRGLTSIDIPGSVTYIDAFAFSGCIGLTSISIPESVVYIDSDAFEVCSDKLTIYGYEDSYAHTYAMENGIPFRLLGQSGSENPKTYTVSFDANGGTGLSQSSRTVTEGAALGELPTVTRTGYTLTGWYTAKTGGIVVTKDTVITADTTIYAQWRENQSQDQNQNQNQNPSAGKESVEKAVITLSKTNCFYNGKAQKPSVKSVKLGSAVLKSGADYTVSYKNNKNIGTATVTITGTGNYAGTAVKTFTISAKKGTSFTVGAYQYKITGASETAFAGLKNSKTKKVIIPKTVKIGGKTFRVTSIDSKALQNAKVTSVTIGANVKTIGASAFAGCGKLVTVTVKSTTLKTVGKNAFKGIQPTAKIKVPSKKLAAYKKLLKNKGQGKKVKITK